jgi:hypothetical protein
MKELNRNKAYTAVFLNMLIFLFITGCATDALLETGAVPTESQIAQESREKEIPLYYDFKDVPVPKEMEIKKERSFVFQTSEFTAGSLSFSGKVEADSLISFFKNKMSEDSWRLLSYFKSPKNIMVFLKEDRFCIITIVGGSFATDLEIIVMPSFHSG